MIPRSAWGVLLLGLAAACSKPDPAKYQSVSEKIMVIIPRGATYYQALDSLESRGVITSRDRFSLYARIRGLPSNLKSGVYTFEKDESWSSIVSTLKTGRGLEVRFTVTEGMMGFEVAGWSQNRKMADGIETFAGEAELDAFLARTDILVVLLPHTPETTGIINRALIEKLSRQGPFGAPILINAGRGKLQAEKDIIDCLKSGALYAASLDVFEQEPLPANSVLWTHPNVYVSPHVAADSDPITISKNILKQIKQHEAGGALENVVDRGKGY